MSSSSMKSLTIQSFRGASSAFKLNFEKGKKLTLIYGENGTGKTTICDGLAFLDEEVASSLDDKCLGTTIEKYWPTLGNRLGNISVILETGSEIYSGKMQGRKTLVTPTANRPRVAVLRRNQISKIVEATAGERYKAIQRFIDIEPVEFAEQELKKLILLKKKNLDRSAIALAEKQGFLEALYATDEKREGQSSKQWAHAIMAMSVQQLDAQIDAVGKLSLAFQNLERESTQYNKAIAELASAKNALDQAKIIEENVIIQAGSEAGEILSLLQSSVQYLQNHPTIPQCPLCDSAENIDGLLERVKEKLIKLTDLSKARKEMESCKRRFEMQERTHANLLENFHQPLSNFITTQKGYAWPTLITLPLTPPPEKMADLAAWLADHSSLPSAWKTVENSWQKEKALIANVTSAVHQFREHYKAHKQLETQIPLFEKAHALMMEERQSFTDKIIKEISADVEKIYEAVHPGEGLNKISMQLNPKYRASLDISSEFYTEKAPPQAYFSQSHLDTLGLSVFLALAKRDDPQKTILVLDDVVGSIDEPHVERVIEMLYEYSKQFQHCIITTHYRAWKEKFRWGWLRDGQCQFVELTRWDLTKGLHSINSLLETERLKKMLEEYSPDLQVICGKAGVILEAALDYLTQKYQCLVPRRLNNAFTLGDLLPAIDKKLRKALRAEICDETDENGNLVVRSVELGPIFDELERIVQVRNAFGVHFKDISFALLEDDARKFADQVVCLMEALTHPEDGWPSDDKSGSYWATSGDLRRLHPLKKPG